jgi:CopG family nickel-responsive transcriptional regulator
MFIPMSYLIPSMRSLVSRISVSLSPDLLDKFGKIVSKIGLDRSKAIQIAMRDFISEYHWSKIEKCIMAGAITLLYDHETKGLGSELTDIQHDFNSIISSAMHVHIDEKNCLEIIAVKGDVKHIRDLSKVLMIKRGVKQVKLSLVASQ